MKSKKSVEKKIMVFGTFDGVHKGHLDFFKQAKALAPKSFLIVSLARDKNIKKIKGQRPAFSMHQRAELIRKTKLADQVVFGGADHHIPHIVKANPHIIALGYDQREYVKNLKKDLKAEGLNVKIVRLKPFRENIYKNSLLKLKK